MLRLAGLAVLLMVLPLACHDGGWEPEVLDPQDGTWMVLVPSGEFTMGTDAASVSWFAENGLASALFEAEMPAHQVYLDGFYIDRTEVSNAQYEVFLEATRRRPPPFWQAPALNGDEQPVLGVRWADADAYCRWAGKRLPTEAEWEKAARGTDARLYPWGDTFQIERCNGSLVDAGGQSHPIARTTVDHTRYLVGESPYGVLHMAGNVSEWVADWYGADYYRVSPTHAPAGPRRGQWRVVRGGSWWDTPLHLRCAARTGIDPENPQAQPIGFRCAKSVR